MRGKQHIQNSVCVDNILIECDLDSFCMASGTRTNLFIGWMLDVASDVASFRVDYAASLSIHPILTPETAATNDKRAKPRIFLIFVLLLHGSPRYRIKLNFGRIMRKFTRLRTRYALYTRHRQLQDTAVGAER